MAYEGAYRFERKDLEAALFSDNVVVRAQFQEHFGDLIGQFLDEAERAVDGLRSFSRTLTGDIRAAWVEAFLFNAFNCLFTSCHLLISGFQVPAGNLMRHYGEASAMSLLCSHHAIEVVRQLDRDPRKYPVHKAVHRVRRYAKALKIRSEGWDTFEAISKWYDQCSHATAFSLATQAVLGSPGQVVLGGEFDEAKRAAYRKELALRVSAMNRLVDLAAAVEQNVRVAQARGLIERDQPVSWM
jgi:hypothetical protein